MFADDLNVVHYFSRDTLLTEVLDTLEKCRAQVHAWGRINRVSFDAGKEHFVVMHPLHGHGEDFILLGLMMDVKLNMRSAVNNIMSRIRPKITILLRTASYYDAATMINQFKIHIWSLMEGHCASIFHASTSILNQLDECQQRFLSKIGCDENTRFVDHNFAPSVLRRNIAVLGLLHKRVLDLAHPAFDASLPWERDVIGREYSPGDTKSRNSQLFGSLRQPSTST